VMKSPLMELDVEVELAVVVAVEELVADSVWLVCTFRLSLRMLIGVVTNRSASCALVAEHLPTIWMPKLVPDEEPRTVANDNRPVTPQLHPPFSTENN